MIRVAICAPSASLPRELATQVTAVAAGFGDVELHFHEQCFAEQGHFAGSDELRLAALVECANDPLYDAVWFARGGYGSNRIAGDAIARMGPVANGKIWLGSSDGGYLLGALYRAGIGRPVHAPMPLDIKREHGADAIGSVLSWLSGDLGGLEPHLDGRPTAAFNLMTLAMLSGTPLMPDLSGHVVMVEEVAEYHYAVDRLLFHVTANLAGAGIAGLRLGRVSDVPWAMVFTHGGPLPRHPSQLYEALLEWVLLFALLWWFSSRPRPLMAVSGAFLLGYGLLRSFVELFREPDAHLGFLAGDWLTMGMLLSLPMGLAGAAMIAAAYRLVRP